LDSNFDSPQIFLKYEWLKNQYDKLIILNDKLKEKFHDVYEIESEQNIHYSYIDRLFNK
jgi:hypothetical protein